MGFWDRGPLAIGGLIALVVGWLAWMVWLPHHLADGSLRAAILLGSWEVVIRLRETRWALPSVISWWSLFFILMQPVVVGFWLVLA